MNKKTEKQVLGNFSIEHILQFLTKYQHYLTDYEYDFNKKAFIISISNLITTPNTIIERMKEKHKFNQSKHFLSF